MKGEIWVTPGPSPHYRAVLDLLTTSSETSHPLFSPCSPDILNRVDKR